MSKHKKRLIWLIGIFGTLFVLITLLLLLLPAVINTDWVKEKIHAEVFQRIGGRIKFERMDVAFLPRPVVVIQQCSFDFQGRLSGAFDSLRAYPEVGPIFHGEVKLSRLKVKTPRVTVTIPKDVQKEQVEPTPPPEWDHTAQGILGGVISALPDFQVTVQEGRLDVLEAGSRVLLLEKITAEFRRVNGGAEIELTAESDVCDRISLEASLEAEDYQGKGSLELKGFQLHRIEDRFMGDTPFQLGETRADITVTFQLGKEPVLQARVEAKVPSMVLQRGAETITLQELGLEAAFSAAGGTFALIVKALNAEEPNLAVSGRMDYDGSIPRVNAALEARNLDVAPLRQAILTLAGDIPEVQDVFEVVRSGRVEQITLNSEGRTVADLADFENLVIRGNMTNGEILIPEEHTGLKGVDFDLKEVQADALISKGVLEARNAQTRWENERTKEGFVRVDLTGKESQLYIETLVEVDLSDLLPLERRLIRSDAVAKELARTHDIRGRAVSRFVLDESTQPMNIRMDVSELEMEARYELLPHQLTISGGQVHYETDRILLKNFRGTLGPSSFSELSMTVGLEKAPTLEVHSGNFDLSVTDLYPWVTSFGPVTKLLEDYVRETSGAISFSIRHLLLPLTDTSLENIDFDIKGSVKDVVLISPLLPAEVHVAEGKFEETGNTLRFTDAQAKILDGSLTVNLVLPDYQKGIHTLSASLKGDLGDETLKWVSDLLDVPPEMRVRPPLEVKEAHIQWARTGRTRISADIVVNKMPRVQVEGSVGAGEVDIEQLTIQDPDSDMTLGFYLKERELHLDLDGRLSHTTMDRLLIENGVLAGVVEGHMDGHIFLDHPMKSTASGKLHAVGLGRNFRLKVPLTIEDIVLDARGDTLEVESALVTWGDTHLNVKGHVAFSQKYFVIDMDVTGDSLHWKQIKKVTAEEQQEEKKEEKTIAVPPVDGVIRVNLDRLETEILEFSPVRARVDLDSDRVTIDVAETQFCGTDAAGTLKVTPQGMSLDLTLTGEGGDVGPLIDCLTDKRTAVTGSYELQARVSGEGTPKTILDSLRGNWNFEAKNGRIQNSNTLTRLLAYLHVVGILKGRYPGLGEKGFEYHSVRWETEIQGTKMLVKSSHLDGVTLDVAATGEVDIREGTVDLDAIAAPFTTVEKIVGWIPGLRYILGGGLIAVPVKVSGKVDDVRITPLAPSAVGSNLLGIMRRIVTAPVKIIDPSSSTERQ